MFAYFRFGVLFVLIGFSGVMTSDWSTPELKFSAAMLAAGLLTCVGATLSIVRPSRRTS